MLRVLMKKVGKMQEQEEIQLTGKIPRKKSKETVRHQKHCTLNEESHK